MATGTIKGARYEEVLNPSGTNKQVLDAIGTYLLNQGVIGIDIDDYFFTIGNYLYRFDSIYDSTNKRYFASCIYAVGSYFHSYGAEVSSNNASVLQHYAFTSNGTTEVTSYTNSNANTTKLYRRVR